MRSTLCEAVARCHLRRLRGIAASAPLPAAVMALVIAAAPFVLFRLGGAVGAEVADSIGDGGRRRGPRARAAARGRRCRARRLRSRRRRDRRSGTRSLPALPAAVVAVIALVLRSGGCRIGRRGAVARCRLRRPCRRASVRHGAGSRARRRDARCRSGRGCRRRRSARSRPRAAPPRAGCSGRRAGLACRGARSRICPARAACGRAAALRDAGSPWVALGVSCAVGIALAAGWVLLAATRPAPRSRRRAVGRSARRRLPAPIAAVVLLARRGDLRLATVGATLFGLTGAALAAATDAPPPAPFLLGTTTALLGSLLCPLVVGGTLDDGRWLWRGAPVRSGAIARSFALSGTAAAAVPVAVVGGVALAASGGGCGINRRRRGARRRRLGRGTSRRCRRPLAERGSRRSDDDDCRVRGDRHRRVSRRRARRPASRCARCSRPGHRGRDLRREPSRGNRRARPAARGAGPMIAATDTVTLAPGVEIRQELLRDVVRGHEWPLNTSGAFVLERSGRPLGEVAGELADAFSLSAPEARGDVLRFVWQLNHLALVNVERTASSLRQLVEWLRLAARLAPAGAVPAPVTRRRAIDTQTVAHALASTFMAVLPRVALVTAIATVLAVHVAVNLGAGLVDPAARRARHRNRSRAARGGACGASARCPERTRRARGRGHASFMRPSRLGDEQLVAAGWAAGRRRTRSRSRPRWSARDESRRGDRRVPARRARTRPDGRRRGREGRMWALKAFVLGSLALGIVGYAVAAALAVAAQAGGTTIDIGVGPLRFVSVTLEGATTATTFGPGILALALAGGVANLAAAKLIRHRAVRGADRVD